MTQKQKGSDAVTDVKETQDKNKGSTQQPLILEVKPTMIIPDGKHEGIIIKIEHRAEPFGYIDISIKEKKTEAQLKLGFPDTITERTGLGKFLTKMGTDFIVGNKIDLNKELLARKVTFMSENEETDKGVFARVIPSTVKPGD